jgi:AAA15 family ATPase/GTPase
LSKHYIKEIEIKNFKCFKDFKAKGFARVNLIGGKNNVGKTAFMEACYINVLSQNIKTFTGALYNIKFIRENLNILAGEDYNPQKYIEQSNHIYTKSNISFCSFDIEEQDGIKKYNFRINNENINVNINDFSFEIDFISNINFIDNFGLSNGNIITAYGSVQKKDDEDKLNKLINEFDNNIDVFKIIEEKPQCKVENGYLEITEFGDGVRHLISIVTSLYKSENGYLFIDEIDNGIHYTMLDKLWEIVLDVSRKLNVQVFATTHSKEGIESYSRVSKKLEDEDIVFIELGKDKNNLLKSIVMDNNRFYRELENGNGVRGW